MSATMARQKGRVQLEQSDMRLALNMAKMAKEGSSRRNGGNEIPHQETTHRGPRREAAGC